MQFSSVRELLFSQVKEKTNILAEPRITFLRQELLLKKSTKTRITLRNVILVGFVRESVILMTSRFTEFSISVRKVFLVARRIVTNENYCLFFLTNIGRNMQFSNAMEKSN